MFKFPYDTTPCQGYRSSIQKISAAVTQAYVSNAGNFRHPENPFKKDRMLNFMEVLPSPLDLPAFAHPIQLQKLPGVSHEPPMVVDMRNFVRTGPNGEKIIGDNLAYDTALLRAMLQWFWMQNSPRELLSLGYFQVTVFSRWLTAALQRSLALPPEVQMRVTVIAAYYYLCMFYEKDEVSDSDEREKVKLAQLISRSTFVNVEDTLKIIEDFKIHQDVNDLVQELIKSSGSSRFERFNLALLYQIVGGSWFGFNYRELVAVALEHPPTWLALMAQGCQEYGYRKTAIGETAKLYDKNDAIKSFLMNLKHLPFD